MSPSRLFRFKTAQTSNTSNILNELQDFTKRFGDILRVLWNIYLRFLNFVILNKKGKFFKTDKFIFYEKTEYM